MLELPPGFQKLAESDTCGFAAMAITYFAAGRGTLARTLLIPVAAVVFLGAFWLLRQAFKRRSGGLGFR